MLPKEIVNLESKALIKQSWSNQLISAVSENQFSFCSNSRDEDGISWGKKSIKKFIHLSNRIMIRLHCDCLSVSSFRSGNKDHAFSSFSLPEKSLQSRC